MKKNYTKPEVEQLCFQIPENLLLETFDLTASSIDGGFAERT